ncbi:MAG: YihY/virulence factor BrkB family protein [Rickettsiales bacterium]|nr:YihY/virulence factor BrkB family protein [Rickettsiales bacterium]
MKKHLKGFWRCLKDAAYDTIITHDGIEHAGYLAFLSLLALFPFLVFTVALVGMLGQGDAGNEFISYLFAKLPNNITGAIKPRVDEIISGPPQGLLTVSILGAIWTASSAIEGIRTILNRAYRVANPPAYLSRRLMSVVQLILLTFVTLSGIVITVLVPLFFRHVEVWTGITIIPHNLEGWKYTAALFTILVLFLSICYIYYIIPNIKQHMVTVAPGALLTLILWLVAAHLFTLYLSNFNQVNLIYGSLGGVIAALLFFYICNIIFIFGAEFNHQIAQALHIRTVEREHTPGTQHKR